VCRGDALELGALALALDGSGQRLVLLREEQPRHRAPLRLFRCCWCCVANGAWVVVVGWCAGRIGHRLRGRIGVTYRILTAVRFWGNGQDFTLAKFNDKIFAVGFLLSVAVPRPIIGYASYALCMVVAGSFSVHVCSAKTRFEPAPLQKMRTSCATRSFAGVMVISDSCSFMLWIASAGDRLVGVTSQCSAKVHFSSRTAERDVYLFIYVVYHRSQSRRECRHFALR